MADSPETVYIFDANSLIDLHRRRYPRATFPGLWRDIEGLCDKGCIVIHEEVRTELEAIDDDLLAWIRSRPDVIAHIDADQVPLVKQVLAKFPGLVRTRSGRAQADAFVVALALLLQCQEDNRFDDMRREVVIVTQEKRDTDPKLRRKIPNACEHFKVPCLGLLEFFARQQWRY